MCHEFGATVSVLYEWNMGFGSEIFLESLISLPPGRKMAQGTYSFPVKTDFKLYFFFCEENALGNRHVNTTEEVVLVRHAL